MRILYVWVAASMLLFTITLVWYISLPIVFGLASAAKEHISLQAGLNAVALVEYVGYAWGPLFDIFILLWALVSSGKRDVESEVYG